MGSYQLRLGSTLTFDTEKEKDIIDCIDELSRSHRLGSFISHLLRLAFESPEEFGSGREVLKLVNRMDSIGMSPTRYNFFSQVGKETEAMKKKVDSIYELAYKTYMLAHMGKTLGLESKADNSLRAAFILERQVTDMCAKLGVDNLNHSFAANKIEETHKKADEVLEFILEAYDSIIEELKESIVVRGIELGSSAVADSSAVLGENKISTTVNDSSKEAAQAVENIEEDDEIIDLPEKPVDKLVVEKTNDIIVSEPTGDRAAALSKMLGI